MHVLITGAGGFIGSHVLDYFQANTDYELSVIDSFRHRGTFSRLDDVEAAITMRYGLRHAGALPPLNIFKHDLTVPFDTALVHRIKKPDIIINLASNSAVERSIHDPVECWRNNCDLMVNVLEYARLVKPACFLHVSTDEVYGDYTGQGLGHAEWDTLLPSNPYAASKAAQEMLCQAYWRTYDMPIAIVNTMNNIGERQDHEKFLPRLIEYIAQGTKIPIYTDPQGNIGARVYLDAKDHAEALLYLARRAPTRYSTSAADRPDKYNVCGATEMDNLAFAKLVASVMDKPLNFELMNPKQLRPGYDRRYLLSPTKLLVDGWQAKTPLHETIKRIVAHCVAKPWWIGA